VGVEHLASNILGRVAAQISDDWQRVYGHPVYFQETFVDPESLRGTCYSAANWVWLTRTTGRGSSPTAIWRTARSKTCSAIPDPAVP
jgi:hypothetical protein